MPRGDAKISEKLLFSESEMNIDNKIWFEEFCKQKKLSSSYMNLVNQFLRLRNFDNKSFDKYDDDDVLEFLSVMLSSGYQRRSTKSVVSIIHSFTDFLKMQHPDIFRKDFIFDYDTLRDSKLVSEQVFDAIQFDLTQLNAIREFNKNNIQDEYIFELFFQLGINKGDFSHCYPQYRELNKNDHFFNYRGENVGVTYFL